MYSDLIGAHFEDGARGPDSFDCYGLAQEIFRRHGKILPDFNISAFACEEIWREIVKGMESQAVWRRVVVPETPSLVVIKNHPRFINHVGTYIGCGQFIHTLKNFGCSIDRISCPSWKKRIIGFYEYVGHSSDNT